VKSIPLPATIKTTTHDILNVLKNKGYSQKDIEVIMDVIMQCQIDQPPQDSPLKRKRAKDKP
jgi:hypothetical protein